PPLPSAPPSGLPASLASVAMGFSTGRGAPLMVDAARLAAGRQRFSEVGDQPPRNESPQMQQAPLQAPPPPLASSGALATGLGLGFRSGRGAVLHVDA